MPAFTETYWNYWGLRDTPFRVAAGSDYYHLGPTHNEALARLHFLVENRRQLGLLLGELGTGKSLLLSRLAGELKSQEVEVVSVAGFGIGAAELIGAISAGLGFDVGRERALHVLWSRLTDRLIERRYQRLTTVLLVDDADRASAAALATLVRLLQLDSTREPNLVVALAAEPLRVARLGARLIDLADLQVELEPWTAEETAEYLERSLAKAGRDESPFDGDAVARLHELTGGRPRRVGQLADLALLAAAGQQVSSIDRETIDSVHRELSVAVRS